MADEERDDMNDSGVDENTEGQDNSELLDQENADASLEKPVDDPDLDEGTDEDEEEEIEPELLDHAKANGLTEADCIAMGRVGVLSHIAAVSRMKPAEKVQEDDPFELKLDPDVLSELPDSLVAEITRIAQAAKSAVKSVRDEVEPLKAELKGVLESVQRDNNRRAVNEFHEWCNAQDDPALGKVDTSKVFTKKDLSSSIHKARGKVFNEIMRTVKNLKPGATLSTEDLCEMAYAKVFKGKQKQQARREVAEQTRKHSASAVGRGLSVKRPEGTNGTRKASIENVRALLRGAGLG